MNIKLNKETSCFRSGGETVETTVEVLARRSCLAGQALVPAAQASNNNNPGQSAPQGYKALVKLDTQYLESLNGDASQRNGLEAGMQVAAEIHQGRRTIMEYLLSPVQKVSAEAGRER